MIGLIIILLGLLIRVVTIRQMGDFRLNIVKPASIKINGVYKYVRHPSYVGSFLLFLGLSLISLHAALLYLVFVFYFARAIQEESLLMDDEKYREYAKNTGMFIPKIRRS